MVSMATAATTCSSVGMMTSTATTVATLSVTPKTFHTMGRMIVAMARVTVAMGRVSMSMALAAFSAMAMTMDNLRDHVHKKCTKYNSSSKAVQERHDYLGILEALTNTPGCVAADNRKTQHAQGACKLPLKERDGHVGAENSCHFN